MGVRVKESAVLVGVEVVHRIWLGSVACSTDTVARETPDRNRLISV
jgi:hypothetical protein